MRLMVPDEGPAACTLPGGRTLTCQGVVATVANPDAFTCSPG
ncbi:hypothetical protein [Rhodovulum sp. BSW8]|nr:hypothetical protein [Rhodovulum sp. BSW8]